MNDATNTNAPSTEQLAERAQRYSAFRDTPHQKLAILPKGASPEAQLTVLQRLGAPNNASGYDLYSWGPDGRDGNDDIWP